MKKGDAESAALIKRTNEKVDLVQVIERQVNDKNEGNIPLGSRRGLLLDGEREGLKSVLPSSQRTALSPWRVAH